MRMTVTLDNVTTDRALNLLSALKAVDLIPDTIEHTGPQETHLTIETPEEPAEPAEPAGPAGPEPSQIETVSEMVSHPAPEPYFVTAADFDLFMDDLWGFSCQRVLDAWVQQEPNANPYHLSVPLPKVGSHQRANLVSAADAAALVDVNYTTLMFRTRRNMIAPFTSVTFGGRYHTRFSREQVVIMAVAETLREALGYETMTKGILLQATTAFLDAYPAYRQTVYGRAS